MRDSRRNSLVFCHAHGAQNLEFLRLAVPGRLCKAFWGVEEKAGKDIHRPTIVHKPLKGGRIAYFSLTAMTRFSKDSHKPAPD
jgi:hypothetical protein